MEGMMKRIERYRSLMAVRSLQGLGRKDALEHIVSLSELSCGLSRTEGVEQALGLAEELRRRGLEPAEDALLHYFQSVAWEKLRLLRTGTGGSIWQWEQPETERQLIHLRGALGREALSAMPRERASRILSNMAALFNHVGRFSEAVEHWDRALKVMPSCSMGRGQRGYALTQYARVLYDAGHVEVLLRRARADLRKALRSGIHEETKQCFRRRVQWVESRFPGRDLDGELELFSYASGCSEDELKYRRWCLEHRLFLSPLNDLGPYPAGARDVLTVPSAVKAGGNRGRAYYHGFFNQLKQAYVSARYLYYEGVNAAEVHFADRDVLLFDTMDFPTYSLAVEKVKASFSMAYSLFDKIALFLNHYLDLSIEGRRVAFRTFWYRSERVEEGLREEFRQRRNWPMRGLFWLGKDLFGDMHGIPETMENSAGELGEIRYHLEHGYLKLHEDFHGAVSADTDVPPGLAADTLAFSVQRGDFEAKTLKLLKMVREALMYLCLSLHLEEKRLSGEAEGGEDLPAVILGAWDDARKI